MGTKNDPGAFDCYANADPDEPMFVLLARDPLAPWLVRLWVLMRRETGCSNHEKQAEASHCAEEMLRWYGARNVDAERRGGAVARAYEAARRVARWIGSGGSFV